MTTENVKTILVFGATGRMGGAAIRHLHRDGWHLRAVTRNLHSEQAQALKEYNVDLFQGNMEKPESLREAFAGVYGVFLVVNGALHNREVEIQQGKNVADLVAEMNIQHLVFAGAGMGERGTGLDHFDSKLDITDYMQTKHLPLTIINPSPFMEMMTDSTLYPQLGMWNAKMKILGKNFCVPWIATDDIGGLAAIIFSKPEEYIGHSLMPVGDWKTVGECAQLYQEIRGKKPFQIPMPVWMLRRIEPELVKMWEWMRDLGDLRKFEFDTLELIYPDTMDVRSFLEREFANC